MAAPVCFFILFGSIYAVIGKSSTHKVMVPHTMSIHPRLLNEYKNYWRYLSSHQQNSDYAAYDDYDDYYGYNKGENDEYSMIVHNQDEEENPLVLIPLGALTFYMINNQKHIQYIIHKGNELLLNTIDKSLPNLGRHIRSIKNIAFLINEVMDKTTEFSNLFMNKVKLLTRPNQPAASDLKKTLKKCVNKMKRTLLLDKFENAFSILRPTNINSVMFMLGEDVLDDIQWTIIAEILNQIDLEGPINEICKDGGPIDMLFKCSNNLFTKKPETILQNPTFPNKQKTTCDYSNDDVLCTSVDVDGTTLLPKNEHSYKLMTECMKNVQVKTTNGYTHKSTDTSDPNIVEEFKQFNLVIDRIADLLSSICDVVGTLSIEYPIGTIAQAICEPIEFTFDVLQKINEYIIDSAGFHDGNMHIAELYGTQDNIQFALHNQKVLQKELMVLKKKVKHGSIPNIYDVIPVTDKDLILITITVIGFMFGGILFVFCVALKYVNIKYANIKYAQTETAYSDLDILSKY
eukprot:265240_1